MVSVKQGGHSLQVFPWANKRGTVVEVKLEVISVFVFPAFKENGEVGFFFFFFWKMKVKADRWEKETRNSKTDRNVWAGHNHPKLCSGKHSKKYQRRLEQEHQMCFKLSWYEEFRPWKGGRDVTSALQPDPLWHKHLFCGLELSLSSQSQPLQTTPIRPE